MCGKISKLMVKYPLSYGQSFYLLWAGLSDDVVLGTMRHYKSLCCKVNCGGFWGEAGSTQESVEFEPENSSASMKLYHNQKCIYKAKHSKYPKNWEMSL